MGIAGGHDPAGAARVFERLVRELRVLPLSRTVARRSGRIAVALRTRGQRLPLPDVLIAATALHHDLTLVTRNLRHYDRIPGLKLPPLDGHGHLIPDSPSAKAYTRRL